MQKPAVHVVDCRLAGFMSDGLRTTSRENAVDESFRVEGREIVRSFAEADELDRHAELLPVSYTHLTLPTSDLV